MEWTEEHDVLLLREIMVSDVFSFKKGSVSRGERWEAILETLNQMKTPTFNLKDKRAVRDRWALLQKRFKSRVRSEEAASGISPPELTEKEVLIEELIGKEDSMAHAEAASLKSQEEEKSKAHDIRQKALERYSETKKRKSSQDGGDNTPKRQRKNARTEPLIEFMQQKSKGERELRQQELDIRRKEQEHSQQVMVTVLQQQQQQMNQAMMSVIQKFIGN